MNLDCKVTFNSDKVATIEPALATLAGWQGENNAVLVNFIISGLNIAAGIQTKYRVDVVDGAGGIHNGVVMELDNTEAYTSLTVPYHLGREITVAGGRAEIKVVITTFENGLEVNTLMTPPFTAVFGNSRSVGSFGEENNKREINDAVRQAENLLNETKNHAQSVAEGAVRSEEAANNSQECLEEATEQVKLAKAEVENAKAEVDNAKAEVDNAKGQVDLAKAEVVKAKSQVNLAKVEVENAKEQAEAARISVAKAEGTHSNKVERKSFYENKSPNWEYSLVAGIADGFYTNIDSSTDISNLREKTILHIRVGSTLEIHGGIIAQITQGYTEITDQARLTYNSELKCYECTLTVEKQPTTSKDLIVVLYTLIHYDKVDPAVNPLGGISMVHTESEGYYELRDEMTKQSEKTSELDRGAAEHSLIMNDHRTNFAGTKCFTVTSVGFDGTGKYVALELGGTLTDLRIGQECKFKINSDRYSTIRLISQGIVTLNCLWSELPSDNRELYIPDTSKGEYRDENDYNLIRNADGTDTEKNSFFIIGHPEIGTNRIIGSHTAVFGRDNKATAEGAFVGGASNNGMGGYSATFGKENRSGFATIVAGRGNDAGSAEYGAVFGTNHTLTPNSRGIFVAGVGNTLGGSYASVVGGTGNKANAVASVILGGANNETKGNYSVVGGYFLIANAHYQTVFGSGNIEDGNALFIIGNGQKDGNGNMVRSNAFAVKKDGSIMLGNKVMLGASKGNNTLIGNTSINSAEASYSTCLGAGTKTTPFNSANPIIGSLAIGKYNAPNTDSLFMVGKGSNDANRSNAFDVKLDGTVIGGKQTTADSGALVLVTKGYLDGLIASLQEQIDELKQKL